MANISAEVAQALEATPDLIETTVSSEQAWKGLFFEVEHIEVELPDGQAAAREFVRHPGGAGVLVVREERVCLIRQWRSPQEAVTLEIPAGKLDPDEEPIECAARELREETGLVAKELTHVATICGAPGFTDERTRVFFAHDCELSGDVELDETEFADAVWLPVDDVLAAIREGKIEDAKTVVAVMAYVSGQVD